MTACISHMHCSEKKKIWESYKGERIFLGLCFPVYPAMSAVFAFPDCDEDEHHSVRRSEVTYLRGARKGREGRKDGERGWGSGYAMHSAH